MLAAVPAYLRHNAICIWDLNRIIRAESGSGRCTLSQGHNLDVWARQYAPSYPTEVCLDVLYAHNWGLKHVTHMLCNHFPAAVAAAAAAAAMTGGG